MRLGTRNGGARELQPLAELGAPGILLEARGCMGKSTQIGARGRGRAVPMAAAMVAFSLGTGCAHQPVEPVDPGRPRAEPGLVALPKLPADCSGRTQRTHQGIVLAGQVLDATMPAPPDDRSYESLQGWVGGEVATWLAGRQAAIEDTRFEFHLSDAPTPGEKIVAHAVIGLIFEHTAASLQGIPAPAELAEEPEIEEMFHEVVRAQTRPFLSSALLEFRSCVDIAFDGPDDMRHWANFCQIRFERLREEIDAAQQHIAPSKAG